MPAKKQKTARFVMNWFTAMAPRETLHYYCLASVSEKAKLRKILKGDTKRYSAAEKRVKNTDDLIHELLGKLHNVKSAADQKETQVTQAEQEVVEAQGRLMQVQTDYTQAKEEVKTATEKAEAISKVRGQARLEQQEIEAEGRESLLAYVREKTESIPDHELAFSN